MMSETPLTLRILADDSIIAVEGHFPIPSEVAWPLDYDTVCIEVVISRTRRVVPESVWMLMSTYVISPCDVHFAELMDDGDLHINTELTRTAENEFAKQCILQSHRTQISRAMASLLSYDCPQGSVQCSQRSGSQHSDLGDVWRQSIGKSVPWKCEW